LSLAVFQLNQHAYAKIVFGLTGIGINGTRAALNTLFLRTHTTHSLVFMRTYFHPCACNISNLLCVNSKNLLLIEKKLEKTYLDLKWWHTEFSEKNSFDFIKKMGKQISFCLFSIQIKILEDSLPVHSPKNDYFWGGRGGAKNEVIMVQYLEVEAKKLQIFIQCGFCAQDILRL
jgi:hypothetical protein